MKNAESVETPKISDVNGQQLLDSMYIHARRKPGVMDLYALYVMRNEKVTPALVDLPAVRQKFEIPLDHTSQTIGLNNIEAKAIFVERASGSVPKLAKRLRGVAEPCSLADQHMKRLADCSMPRVIAFADPQQDVTVE